VSSPLPPHAASDSAIALKASVLIIVFMVSPS
jgi:hypothetical protein